MGGTTVASARAIPTAWVERLLAMERLTAVRTGKDTCESR
jgi:hypothetical protein